MANVMVGAIGNNGGALNTGRIWVELKPRAERTMSVDQVIAGAAAEGGADSGHPRVHDQPAAHQSRRRAGRTARAVPVHAAGHGHGRALQVRADHGGEDPRPSPASRTSAATCCSRTRKCTVEMDRNKVSTLGLTANQVENALYNAYGTRQVSQIYAPNNQYQVILQVAPEFQKDPAAMSLLYVRSNNGTLIPLESVARLKTDVGPMSVSHFGQLPAVTISFNLKPGFALGDAVRPDQGRGRREPAVDHVDELPGRGAGVPGFAAGPRPHPADGDRRHLHRPGRALRELHAPADDSLGPAVGRLRRAADAAASSRPS